ncbi:MAG: hypothetical protein IPK53_17695 [bacterium]|nr:hypothetical protein [bacterium]
MAGSFVGNITLESGQQVSGAGIATSSLLYLALPIVMAFVLRWTKLSLLTTTLIFLPLVGAAIWFGQYLPLDLASWFGVSDLIAQKPGSSLSHILFHCRNRPDVGFCSNRVGILAASFCSRR